MTQIYSYNDYKHLIVGALPQFSRAEELAYNNIAKSHADPNVRSKAREKLVRTTFRFVLREAIKFGRMSGLNVEDLVIEAKKEIWKAVSKFDPGKEVKFLSFVRFDIQHAFQIVQRKNMPIKGMSYKDLGSMSSLDAPVSGSDIDHDTESTMGHLLVDESDIAEGIRKDKEDHDRFLLDGILEGFSTTDREMLNKYYGLDGQEPMSMSEIAKERGVSPQGVNAGRTRILLQARRIIERRIKEA